MDEGPRRTTTVFVVVAWYAVGSALLEEEEEEEEEDRGRTRVAEVEKVEGIRQLARQTAQGWLYGERERYNRL